MRKKVWKVAMVGIMAMVLIVAGCGNNKGNSRNEGEGAASVPQVKGKMIVYDYGQADEVDIEIYKKLIEEFNARDDMDAVIEYNFIPGDAYYPKINAIIAANEAPDLFSSHAAGKMEPYVNAKKLLPLNDALEADAAWYGKFKKGILEQNSFDGKVYGIPTSMNTVGIFYNEKIFEQYDLSPPATYEDLKHVVEVLSSKSVVPIAFGAKDPWTAALFAELIDNRIGGSAPYNLIAAGEGSWEDPSFIQSGRIMQELVTLGAFPEGFLGMGYDEIIAMFKNGEAGMFVMGSWALGSLSAEDSKIRDHIGLTTFPVFPDGKGNPNAWLGSPDRNLVVGSTSKYQTEAIEFIKMWARDEVQSEISQKTGRLIVTNAELDAEQVLPLGAELSKLMETMTEMFLFYDVGLGPKIGDEYNNTVVAILAGQDPESAYQRLQQYTEENR